MCPHQHVPVIHVGRRSAVGEPVERVHHLRQDASVETRIDGGGFVE